MQEKIKWVSTVLWDSDPISDSLYLGDTEVVTGTKHNKSKTLNQLKRAFDLKSFGLWDKNIPDITELQVGETITIPHYIGNTYYGDGDKHTGSVELKVKELRTITESKTVTSSTGAKNTYKNSRVVVAVEYHSGTKFYNLFRSSRRRQNGSYYRTQQKKTLWIDQRGLLKLFLMDGGLCPLIRNKQSCAVCDY
jgi:hypothetical protein